MTDKPELSIKYKGALNKAALYGSSFETASNVLLECFESPAGEIAIALARGPGKTTPVEDSAGAVPLKGGGVVLMVADGLGGLPTGWKASGLVVERIKSELEGAADEEAEVRAAILDGIEKSNAALLEFGTGTATTLIVAEIREGHVRTFHIGDSAAWVCGQKGLIKMQTTPHSPVGFAVESGLLNEDEALDHEELNVISNVVGSNDMRIEIGPRTELAQKDTVLIASDGLLDNLLEEEIVEIIRAGTIADSLEQLWTMAARRMAGADDDKPSKPDDFSVILFRPRPPNSG